MFCGYLSLPKRKIWNLHKYWLFRLVDGGLECKVCMHFVLYKAWVLKSVSLGSDVYINAIVAIWWLWHLHHINEHTIHSKVLSTSLIIVLQMP